MSVVEFTYRHTHTYVVQGTIAVASGGTDYLGPFPIPVVPGQRALLIGVWLYLRNGTCNVSILQNGSATGLSDLTNIGASTTGTFYELTTFQDIANLDAFRPVVSSPAGTPDNLCVGFVVEYTLTLNI